MRRTLTALALGCILTSLPAAAGTSEIRHEIPFTRMESSEALGTSRDGKASFSVQGALFAQDLFLKLSDDFTSELVGTNPPDTYRARTFAFAVDVSPVRRLDVSTRFSANTPFFTQLKYQFLGDEQIYADRGNFSASVFLGYGRFSAQKSDRALFGNSLWGEQRWQRATLDFGLSAGYRLHARLLTYLTWNRSFLRLDGRQRVETSVVEWTAYKRKGQFRGYHFGFRWHPPLHGDDRPARFFLQAEATRANLKSLGVNAWENSGRVDLGFGF